MTSSSSYILIGIVALVLIALSLIYFRPVTPQQRLSPLAGVAFALILAGLFFSDNRLVGYSLFLFGLLFAILDINNKYRNR